MDRPAYQTEQDVRTRDTVAVGSFLEVDPDGTVNVYSGKVELGTGIATAFAQIVADELGVPFDRIRMVMGDTALTPDQGTTAGSKTVQIAGRLLRRAAAEARRELLDRAADWLEVAPEDLTVMDGVVRPVDGSAAAIPIGDLAGEPFSRKIPDNDEVRGAHHVGLVGQSVPRVDLFAKVTGGEAYVHDIQLDGMLHGRVIRPYVRTMAGAGRIAHVDDRQAKVMPGVVAIVRNGDFLGVVAEREEESIRAAESVQVTWEEGDRLPSREGLHELMRAQPENDTEPLHKGDVDAAMGSAARTMTATYRFPMQAHASMGPSCAVADVRGGSATIYTSTQGVYGLRQALAPLLGLDEDRTRLIFREGAGCYGHNGADDVTADAALLSQAVGRPVRVQWMRRDEFAWEPKGPAMLVDMGAGLDDGGAVTAWDHTVWTPTHTTRPGGQPGNLLAGQQVDPPMLPAVLRNIGGDRNAPTTYTFPSERVTMHWLNDAPLRPSAFRSLGGLHNTTANEMFLDEVATATGVDPVEMRLRYLGDPRAREVVNAAAQRARWGSPLPAIEGLKSGRGFAYARYEAEYTYVAMVAEVAVDPDRGGARVTRVVVAHDCGLIVNPDGVRNQIEGNVIQGISRSLKEEVTWDNHEVTSLTWETYPILTFPEVPEIEIVLIDRPDAPSYGAGEPAICPVTAAIGNAIFATTGVRLRDVPFTPERLLAAMSSGD
ncbi:MAG TPA: molybdopterin cofactor-binding domain-containing protein [Thermomicrobiales bacterium]|nr:molybdopterin cofactor-binding domain-containing protein [Thermomicrobiales bacterium]